MPLTSLGESCYASLKDVRSLRVVFLSDGTPGGITITFKSFRRDITLRKRDSRLCWPTELAPLCESLSQVGHGLWLDLTGLIRVDKWAEGQTSPLILEFAPHRAGDPATTFAIDPEIGDSAWEALRKYIASQPTE